MLRGASKHKKKRKTTSVWPGSQWSKSEIRCESRNIMCSAKWAKLSWQDKVGSGLTLIYGVVLKHSFGAGWRGDTGGLQTHCKFLLDWSEQTALETSLRYQAKHVESPFLFQTLDPRSWSQCTPPRLCECFHLLYMQSSMAPLRLYMYSSFKLRTGRFLLFLITISCNHLICS